MANKEPDTTPLLDLFLLAVFIFSLAQRSEIIQKDKILQEVHFSTAYVWKSMLYQEKDKSTVKPLFRVDSSTAKEKFAELAPNGKTHVIKIKLEENAEQQDQLQGVFKDCNIFGTFSRAFFFHVDKDGSVKRSYLFDSSSQDSIQEQFSDALTFFRKKEVKKRNLSFIVLLDKEASPAIQEEVKNCISQNDEKISLLMIER